ncbi:large ribosomal subunit protein uL1m-like [Babylonia areolata]|uniref:large ribosomal subunit protein uL1m-like n=1 Tax=Babylonia areolata TaxID=304850 RepID=UPI003FD3CB8D
MASARGLITLTSGLLSSAVPLQCSTPCSLRASICPLLSQVRHRNQKKTRFKAPPEPKQMERWSKTVKQKFDTVSKVSKYSEAFLSRVPVDDVWIRTHYLRPRFSLEECLDRHKEFAEPCMLDNLEGFVYADMQLDMKTKKKTKFLPNVKGTLLLPYQFEQNVERKIAIICKKEEDMEKAKNLGASFVGGVDLVKQIQEGLVDKDDIDAVLCTPEVITELIPIRSLLKDKFPNKGKGSVGSDIEEMWTLYSKGVTYNSQKETDAVGRLQVPLGQLKMPTDELMANFTAYVEDICKGRAKNLGPLITQILVIAPPSTERFLLQIEDYVPGYEKRTDTRQEDSDSEDEEAAA